MSITASIDIFYGLSTYDPNEEKGSAKVFGDVMRAVGLIREQGLLSLKTCFDNNPGRTQSTKLGVSMDGEPRALKQGIQDLISSAGIPDRVSISLVTYLVEVRKDEALLQECSAEERRLKGFVHDHFTAMGFVKRGYEYIREERAELNRVI